VKNRTGLAWLEQLASRRLGAVALFAAALVVYTVEAVGWPLIGGRDLDEYLYDYAQLLDRHPVLPWSMLFRTPVPGIVDGAALDVAGGFFAEPLLAVLFAASIVAWTLAARAFGPRAALLVAFALLVYPAYGLMFHELSSEPVFAAAFALWALLVVRAATRPSARAFAFVGLGIALLALVRPGNALLLGFVLFVLAVGGTWRKRAVWAAAFLGAALVPLVAWAILNGVRFGDYTLARGGNAVIPFYRAYIQDKIVRPDNGPASRKLAAAVRAHLVTRNPYKAYGVSTAEVFRSGSFRIHEDFYLLSDHVFGWDSNYSILRKAGIEAVRKHPGAYASGVLDTIWQQLSKSYFRTPPGPATPPPTPMVVRRGNRLPAPSEGQPIPAGQSVWISRPDNCIGEVWTSATDHHFTFCSPTIRRRFDVVKNGVNGLFRNLPTRRGNSQLALRMNQASRWYPRLFLWIAVALVALILRRPRGARTLVAIALAALFVIVFNALGLFADPRFALPVAPAFVLFAAGALLGPRTAASANRQAPVQ
jgi:Dolichyl-phosphate-mannose-protein mannosyltransferase